MLEPNFLKFQGDLLSELSGVAPVADGRLLVVNDTDPKKALFVLKAKAKGGLEAHKPSLSDTPKTDDLEGVVVMGGYYYAVSSHAEDRNRARRTVPSKRPSDSFGSNAPKYGVTADFELLNLDGGDIRSMSFMANLGGYLVTSGASVSRRQTFPCMPGSGMQSKFLLWFWEGKSCGKRILCFKKRQDTVQSEGISPASMNGNPSVLIVSTDGDETKMCRPGTGWPARTNKKNWRSRSDPSSS